MITPIKATEMSTNPETFYLRAMLLGPSGSGKSWGSITAPAPVLLLDLDGRKESLSGITNLDILPFGIETSSTRAYAELMKLFNDIFSTPVASFPYKTLVIDGLTPLNEIIMTQTLASSPGIKQVHPSVPAQQHYAVFQKLMNNIMSKLLVQPINVILNGHINVDKDEITGGERLVPLVTGATKMTLPGRFNEVYSCSRRTSAEGKLAYIWNTSGTTREECFKSSLNKANRYWDKHLQISWDAQGLHHGGFCDILEKYIFKVKEPIYQRCTLLA